MNTHQYVVDRDNLIHEIFELVELVYPGDDEMIMDVANYTSRLKTTDINEGSIKFVDGMLGFINYVGDSERANDKSGILVTLLHDLTEFIRNGKEAWFSPRTESYVQFAKK